MTDIDESIPDMPPLITRHKTSFAGDVLKLVSGTTIAQAIGILITPLLTRLYGPDAFGTLALFTSITSILGVIACMRYELAIMLPESDEEAANLLGVSLGFAVILALLTIPVIWWTRAPLLNLLNAQELAPYLWLVPLMVLAAGIFLALNYWNSRTKRFGRLSISRVIQSGSVHSIKLGGGVAGYTTGGTLIGATVIGQVIATGVLVWQVWRDDASLFLRSIRWEGMWYGIKRHRKFPLYGIWSALLNNISWQLPAILLSAFFSSTIVGYYALGFRMIKLPMSLIGSAIAQVFFQRATEAKNEGTLALVVESTFIRLVRLGLFPSLMLAFIGRDVFAIVFGAEWTEAGVYVQILSVWTFFWFISSPISTLFSVLERQDLSLYINLLVFISRVFALIIGGYLNNARLAIMLFGISGILVYGYLNILSINYSGVSWKSIWQILLTNVSIFIPVGIIMLVFIELNISIWVILVFATLTTSVYLLYIVRTDPQFSAISSRVPILNKLLSSKFPLHWK